MSGEIDPSKMSGASDIIVRLGINFERTDRGDGFELEWNSEKSSSHVNFSNTELWIRSIPKPEDVDLRLGWESDEQNLQTEPLQGENPGEGTITLDNNDITWSADNEPDFTFYSTSKQLSFEVEHEIQCDFEEIGNEGIDTVITAENDSDEVKYDVNFDWEVPNNATETKSGYDFSDSFNFTVIYPRFEEEGEVYWAFQEGTLTTDSLTEQFTHRDGDLDILENTTYEDSNEDYSNTQLMGVEHNLAGAGIDEDTGYGQEWDFNFTAPNAISNMIIDSNEDFDSHMDQIVYGENASFQVDYSNETNTGTTGANWANETGSLHSNSIGTNGISDAFTGENSWNTGDAELGNYSAITNYTAQGSDYDMPKGMDEIARFGYMYRPFDIVRDTEIAWVEVSHNKTYDTSTHGMDGELMNITAKWVQSGGSDDGDGITEGSGKISIFDWFHDEPVEENGVEWSEQEMIDNDDGTYSVFIDPTSKDNEGNMTWGYRDFTISFSKKDHLAKDANDNFSIIVDTDLSVRSPDSSGDFEHYTTADMASNVTGEEETADFRMTYEQNTTESNHLTDNPGTRYHDMIELNYTCLNYTRGELDWWNWTWNEDEFSESNAGNPINGTFTWSDSSNRWGADLYYPREEPYFTNIPEYDAGIMLEYNVTARVKRDDTEQPDEVEPQWLEEDNTIFVELTNPDEGNFTRVVPFNDEEHDGNPFAMGEYDNKSETYKIEQYHNNQTIGPHDNTSDTFRLRVLFNCTVERYAGEDNFEHPPCGPLNDTETTEITLSGWGDEIKLESDEDYLWSTEVLYNESGEDDYRTYYGVTYVTPWLNFSDRDAGNHKIIIEADREGYRTGRAEIDVKILEQETELLHKNETVSDEDTSKSITQDVPYLNTTSLTVTYNDITNENVEGVGDEGITGAEITCVEDFYAANYFVENSTGDGEATWRWIDEGNGKYTIEFLYTDFINYMEDPDNTRLEFNIDYINAKERSFTVNLNITSRRYEIDLLSSNNESVYTEHEFEEYKSEYQFLTYEFEILDLDNNSNPVNFDLSEGTEGTSPRFDFDCWEGEQDPSSRDYYVIDKITNGSSISYNITIDHSKSDVGEYNLMFSISPNDDKPTFYETHLNTSFDVISAPITLEDEGLDSGEEIEYIISTIDKGEISKDNYEDLFPYLTIKLIDTAHTERAGSDKVVEFDGMYVSTNYSNDNYSDFNTHSPEVSFDRMDEDLRIVEDEGICEVFIDAQTQDTGSYDLSLTFNKSNYITTNKTFSFTVVNATTMLEDGDVNFDWQEDEISEDERTDFPHRADFYGDGIKIIPWGKYVGIRFGYLTNSTNKEISSIGVDDIEEMDTKINIISTNMSDISKGEVLNSTKFYEVGSGVHYIDLPLNFTDTGTIEINFSFGISADNFDPVEFPINLIIHDRETDYLNRSRTTEVEWTDSAEVENRYRDLDHEESNYYITKGCYINGTSDGSGGIMDLNGNLARWNYTEYPNDEYHKFQIETENLTVGEVYEVHLNLSKPHYKEQIISFKFEISPLPLEAEYTIYPSDEFEAEEEDTIEIHMSMFIELKNGTGETEILGDCSILPNISITYQINGSEGIVHQGEFEWSDAEQNWVASFATHDEDDDPLAGIFEVGINITTNSENVQGKVLSTRIFGVGEPPAEIPGWFYILLTAVIGAAVAMAGYGIRKALYLRIPFVLRKIDETIKKIEKDKYPAVGVMTGRQEFIINKAIEHLDECGIQWEREDKFEVKKVGEAGVKEELPPYSEEEIVGELDQIPGLSKEESSLFVEELKRLDRDAQDEFLASLRGDIGETEK
ncbi:MAG: hypothetical protein R6U96_11610 [Promethearchaeia archaeon]